MIGYKPKYSLKTSTQVIATPPGRADAGVRRTRRDLLPARRVYS
jgi:hypothetical protein